jgi:hypothetical protein
MHEMADCSSSRTIKEDEITELSTDTYHRAAHKAAKRAMGDVQGRSGPIFKKYATMANKFRDKGMSQEKKEKAAKAVKEEAVNEISTKLALSYDKGASKSMDTAAAKGSAGHETFMKRSAGRQLALDKTNPEHKRLKAKVGTSDANAKDAAYKKAIGEEVIDEKLTDDAKKVIRGALRGPEMKKTSGPARAMIQIAKMNPKNVKEDLAVPLLGGDQKDDESAEMVKAELKAIANQAMNLVMQIPDTMIIEPWVQSKIAQAKIMISGVHDYMVYGDHDKPEEDEQTDTPLTLPNMSVDVNTGQNV